MKAPLPNLFCATGYEQTPTAWLTTLSAGRWDLAGIGVDRLEQCSDRLFFVVMDLGAPHIEDQDDAVARPLVPGLVLDGVVEHQQFAFAPFPRFAADAKTAAGRNDQRQMADQPGIHHPMMRRNAGAGSEAREENRWR